MYYFFNFVAELKESAFIQQNKEKWREYEALVKNKTKKSDLKLSDAFEGITDDLVYARTHFKHRSVRVYLNSLARSLFTLLYRKRRDRWSHLMVFVTDRFPAAMWAARYELLFSFLIFLFSFIIGWFSSHRDPDFDALILGEQYVRMTEANIKSGDPLAVYQTNQPDQMFLRIFLNNLWVDFLTLSTGLLYGLGTFFILLRNGIMVGSFQHFFVHRGYATESLGVIWMHGTLEIATIILSGAAGFALARGLLFNGHLKRRDALRIHAVKAIYLLVGIIPMTFVAALIEGYLTGAGLNSVLRWTLIGISFSALMGYFIIYALLRGRQLRHEHLIEYRPPVEVEEASDFVRIADLGEILQKSLKKALHKARVLIPFYLLFSLVYGLWLLSEGASLRIENLRIISSEITQIMDVPRIHGLLKADDLLQQIFMGFLLFGGIMAALFSQVSVPVRRAELLLRSVLYLACSVVLVWGGYDLPILAICFVAILFATAEVISLRLKQPQRKAAVFEVLLGSRFWFTFFLSSLIALVLFTVINSPLLYILREGVLMHFLISKQWSIKVLLLLRFGILWSFVLVYLSFLMAAMRGAVASGYERVTADQLRSQFKKQGLEI